MREGVRRKLLFGFVLLLALLSLFADGKPNLQSASATIGTLDQYNIFLPLVFNNYPIQTVFGVEMLDPSEDAVLDQVSALRPTWIRRNAVFWSEIEEIEGTRDWSRLAGLEEDLLNANSKGIQTMLVVRRTPDWAQKVPGSVCGPIRSDKMAAFASFMHDLVARYGASPYKVIYWEIWNEPDVGVVQGDSWGCWGDSNDAYFGGGYYAQMLQAVYPQIKAGNPNAQIVVGGLLLDCDPRGSPSPCTVVGNDPKPPLFFEGILRNGGGNYFDGVAFHAYDYYQGEVGQYVNPNWNSRWDTTGPVMIAKANYIKSLLAGYAVSGKFLMNTESAVLFGDGCVANETIETTKAYYVAQEYASAIAHSLRVNIWFHVFGWRCSGLLNEVDHSTLPAYTTFQFARTELRNAIFLGNINDYPGVKGYRFNRGDRTIWVLWSLDGSNKLITLPATPVAAWDSFGVSVTPTSSMTVSLNPLYLEWNP